MSEGAASGRLLYGAAWALCAALLLCAGFAAVVAVGAALAISRTGPAAAAGVTNAFGIYGAVVLVKGLLPALVLALALWALLDRVAPMRARGRIAVALGLLAAATLGSVAAAGLLMPLQTRAIASVHYTGAGNFLRTSAEMAVPVALSLWIPRALLPASRRRLAFVLAGIAVVFVAGGASIARYALRAESPAPGAVAPAAAQPETAPALGDGEVIASEAIPGPEIDPAALDALRSDGSGEPLRLGWEEIQRRQAMAERLRALIDAGPDATEPPVVGGLLAEGQPVAVYRDGELAGIALQNVPPDGFYAQLGLREGDVVESINGVPFDAPDAAGALLGAVLGSQPIEITVERDGAAQQLAVPRERVLEGLRAMDLVGSAETPR